MSEVLNQFKREGYNLFEEAKLIETTSRFDHEGISYSIKDMVLKDYRSEKESYNGIHHSVLPTVITVQIDGKEYIHESKYDTGYPQEGITVETIANRIKGSSGRTMRTKPDNVFGSALQVIELLTPPALNSIIELHCWELKRFSKKKN